MIANHTSPKWSSPPMMQPLFTLMVNQLFTLNTSLTSMSWRKLASNFNETQLIYPKVIRTFWRNSEFMDNKAIVSKVLGVTVTQSNNIIAKSIGCLCEVSTYYEGLYLSCPQSPPPEKAKKKWETRKILHIIFMLNG